MPTPTTKARAGPVVRATAALLGRLLDTGELGAVLPAERVLARWLDVNRLTLRWATERLIAVGRLQRQQGSGVRCLPASPSQGQIKVLAGEDAAGGSLDGWCEDRPRLVLLSDERPPLFGGWTWRAALAIAQRARQRGDAVMVMTCDQLLRRVGAPRVLRALRGVVTLNDRMAADAFEQVLALPVAVVGLGRTTVRSVHNVLDVDWEPAIAEALRHLPRGRALLLCDAHAQGLDRQQWCAMLAEKLFFSGISANALEVRTAEPGEGGAYLAVRRYLRRGGDGLALVFADDDLSAAGARRALSAVGHTPARCVTIGCGGTRVSQYLRPRLSTFAPPMDRIARMADEWLMGVDSIGRRFTLQRLSARYLHRT